MLIGLFAECFSLNPLIGVSCQPPVNHLHISLDSSVRHYELAGLLELLEYWLWIVGSRKQFLFPFHRLAYYDSGSISVR